MVEAVGHVIQQFPKGTDYILKFKLYLLKLPWRIMKAFISLGLFPMITSILVLHIHQTQQPMSRYRAARFLLIPLGISILKPSPIKPDFHLQITLQGDSYLNRTHVQKPFHRSFSECSQYFDIPSAQPLLTGFEFQQLHRFRSRLKALPSAVPH